MSAHSCVFPFYHLLVQSGPRHACVQKHALVLVCANECPCVGAFAIANALKVGEVLGSCTRIAPSCMLLQWCARA
ncbi:hypothetical protein DUNSADRAFT_10951 [Dunaliella salina]|uniref:Uncharacterized protein n=1 Tax=Dunaliella salina TaxID=3046 RepID=A0ABQ7GEG4_DUNSA|nr:hypothetical protein DUNSADRAFT_10951 [Dunaliella salina]|eukprot:KAF5832995.1 hypothetical protein DUNSADRAFT_10951 [Dunaliella salina]